MYFFEQNILLTVCRQNIYRLWVESNTEERFQFSVCSVIQPTTISALSGASDAWDLSPAVEWLNTHSTSVYAQARATTSNHYDRTTSTGDSNVTLADDDEDDVMEAGIPFYNLKQLHNCEPRTSRHSIGSTGKQSCGGTWTCGTCVREENRCCADDNYCDCIYQVVVVTLVSYVCFQIKSTL